jgi:hypothetical protein
MAHACHVTGPRLPRVGSASDGGETNFSFIFISD